MIDQMVVLKATSLFDGHLMDNYMTCRITLKLERKIIINQFG
jgi:hypothetical protein